jgi:hemerythrin-like metal-binding protein
MIDFDIAKIWHRLYAEKLRLVAAGASDEAFTLERVCDDASCTLGKWLYGAGWTLADTPAYQQLQAVHQAFHAAACEYLSLSQGEEGGQHRQQAEAELAHLSAGIIAAIDRLQADVAAQNLAAAPASPLPPIVLDDSLAIGVETLDAHHQLLAEIIGKLMRDPEAALHSEYAVDNLTDLGKILTLHFSIEEDYMRQLDMPPAEYLAHRKKHQEILEQWARMNIASYANRNLKVKDVAAQVRDWAIDHIAEYDLGIKKYMPVVRPEC